MSSNEVNFYSETHKGEHAMSPAGFKRQITQCLRQLHDAPKAPSCLKSVWVGLILVYLSGLENLAKESGEENILKIPVVDGEVVDIFREASKEKTGPLLRWLHQHMPESCKPELIAEILPR